MRGKRFGNRYIVKGLIGEGGMASVYVALDETLDRKVAIKIMLPKLSKDKALRKRFNLEAKTLSGIDHPNIVSIYDYSGDDSEQLWIVTEILRGSNLAQYIRKNGQLYLHYIVATLIIMEVAKALEHAHSKGVIHRDIKPENIMILNDGRIKLMDFGIARDKARNNMTMTGTFIGSPSYMPPEQIRGGNTDNRSDIYSLSVMYYEIITGSLPFEGSSTPEVINKILEAKYLKPSELKSWIPEDINDLICTGINSDPQQRYQNTSDLRRDLDKILQSVNFSESHIELERMFKDRHAFEKRLEKLIPKNGHKLLTAKKLAPPVTKKNLRIKSIDQKRKVFQYNGQNINRNFRQKKISVQRNKYQENWKTIHYTNKSRRYPVWPSYLLATILCVIFISLSYVVFNKTMTNLNLIKASISKPKKIRNRNVTKTREKPKIKPQINFRRVFINSTPAAQLTVDSIAVGNTDEMAVKVGILLEEGLHNISLSKSGYLPFKRVINITSKTKRFIFNLERRADQTLLSVQTNRVPTKLTIISKKRPGNKLIFLMNTTSKIIKIRSGKYKIRAQYRKHTMTNSINLVKKSKIETVTFKFQGVD